MTPPRCLRSARLQARITADQKRVIESAAALQGRRVTDFVLTSIQDGAHRVIEQSHRLELSKRNSEAFESALLNPQPVNQRLEDTVCRYRQITGV